MAFYEKHLAVKEPLVVAGRHVKRYEVVTPGLEITNDIRAAAYAFLPKLYPDFADPTPAGHPLRSRQRETHRELRL